MGRYQFLNQDQVFEAFNRLRSAFLAAKDGGEVDQIIDAILTHDEKIKIGRRIKAAELLKDGNTYESIRQTLQIGFSTIKLVDNALSRNQKGFDLINLRQQKVEKEYAAKAYTKSGGSKLIYKPTKYTGFTRKKVSR